MAEIDFDEDKIAFDKYMEDLKFVDLGDEINNLFVEANDNVENEPTIKADNIADEPITEAAILADIIEVREMAAMEDTIANEPIVEAMNTIEDEFTQFTVQKRTYKCFKDSDENRKVHGKREVLEANELEFDPNDKRIIIHNESNRSYMVFDSENDLLNYSKGITGPKSFHEVIIGSHHQKIKFDIDLKLPFEGFDRIPEISDPQMPLEPAKPDENELTGDDDIDALVWDTYNGEVREYGDKMAKYNTASAKCNAMPSEKKKFIWLNRVMMSTIESTFGDCFGRECSVAVCDSSKEGVKYSRHYIITDFAVENNREAMLFTDKVINALPPAFPKAIIDMGINKSLQNFRLPGSSKVGSDRVKKIISAHICEGRIIDHTFEDCLITHTANTELLPPKCPREEVQAPSINIDDAEMVKIIKMAGEHLEGFRYRRTKGNIINFNRIASSYCQLCQRMHDHDNTAYIKVDTSGAVTLKCRHNDKSIELGNVNVAPLTINAALTPALKKKRAFPKYIQSLKADTLPLVPEFTYSEYNVPYVNHIKFENDKYDAVIIKSGMGTGKSVALREYIKTVPDHYRIVIVSFRRSFTSEVAGKLNEFTDYQDVKKGTYKLPRMIVQFESLHKLDLMAGTPTVLILDESESILNQMKNPQMSKMGTLMKCWAVFEWLLKYSSKLIAIDAVLGPRTLDLLKVRKSVLVECNNYIPPPESAPIDIYYEKADKLLAVLYDYALRATTEPMVVVCGSKTKADIIYEKCQELNPNARIKYYNVNTTPEDREGLKDVNKVWKDVDILIYTPTIMAGGYSYCTQPIPIS